MAISDHTRKVLWSLSGNACARCDTSLVHEPEARGDVHAITGRECHIVARAPGGPRADAGPRGDIDGYGNLILLCANCHAVIDGQPECWPPDALRRMKREHEQKVARRNAPAATDLRWRGRDKPLRLELVASGDALVDVVGSAFSYVYERPDRMTSSQREKVGDFLQSSQDWGEIYGDIGPKGHLDAGQDLQDGLDGLREEGLVVYATTRQLTLVSGENESPWPEAVVKIVHEHEAVAKPTPAPPPS